MRNLQHHTPEARSIGPFHYLVQLAQAQTAHDLFVLFGSANRAAHKLDFNLAVHKAFATARQHRGTRMENSNSPMSLWAHPQFSYNLSTATPLISATTFLSRSCSKASM